MKKATCSLAFLFIVFISACERETTYTCKAPCILCEKAGTPEIILCREDYSTSTEYGLAGDVVEAQGYNCSTTTPSHTKKASSESQRTEFENDGYECIAD